MIAITTLIAVVRQQFVLEINRPIFLYWNLFGASQRLAFEPEVLQNWAGFTLGVVCIGLLSNRGEKPAIGQFLRGSLPLLTNDRDTKREKMT